MAALKWLYARPLEGAAVELRYLINHAQEFTLHFRRLRSDGFGAEHRAPVSSARVV